MSVDSSDRVFTAAHYSGTVDVGGGPLVSSGQADMVLASYTSPGEHCWSRNYGAVNQDGATALLADDVTGAVYAAGWYAGSIHFGGPASGPTAGRLDGVIVKLVP